MKTESYMNQKVLEQQHKRQAIFASGWQETTDSVAVRYET